MAERVVINASMMIALLAIGQEGLLPMLFDDRSVDRSWIPAVETFDCEAAKRRR